jgi:hypothetical protein
MTYLTLAKMGDAAFAQDIRPGFEIAAGYYGGPGAYHVWSQKDWDLFPGYRLPIWVPSPGNKNGVKDGQEAVAALQALKVPPDVYTVVDMEVMRDRTYVTNFAATIHGEGGYRLWNYGSESTVFSDPPANGWWVAAYGLTTAQVLAILESPHVRAVQHRANIAPGYDASLVRQWTEGGMWHG